MNTIFQKKFPVIVTIGIVAGMFSACDKIEYPYGKKIELPDTVACPPPQFTPNTAAARTVLVEDYTGHTCGNCPPAADVLKQMVDGSGGKIIGMAVHCGATYAAPQLPDYPEDHRTAVGEAFDAQFGVSSAGQPNGMVNRKVFSGNRVVFHSNWVNRANQILTADPNADLDIQISNCFVSSTQKIVSYVYVSFLKNMPGNYKLGVYVTEDHVIADQKKYTYDDQGNLITLHIEDYDHMHMLRGSLSAFFGEQIGGTDVAQGFSIRKDFSQTINTKWNPQNCHVVAVVYNADTFEIVQSAEAKFIP
jgi:hypothetical protein